MFVTMYTCANCAHSLSHKFLVNISVERELHCYRRELETAVLEDTYELASGHCTV
jgi:hypothetical protein